MKKSIARSLVIEVCNSRVKYKEDCRRQLSIAGSVRGCFSRPVRYCSEYAGHAGSGAESEKMRWLVDCTGAPSKM